MKELTETEKWQLDMLLNEIEEYAQWAGVSVEDAIKQLEQRLIPKK